METDSGQRAMSRRREGAKELEKAPQQWLPLLGEAEGCKLPNPDRGRPLCVFLSITWLVGWLMWSGRGGSWVAWREVVFLSD